VSVPPQSKMIASIVTPSFLSPHVDSFSRRS
jgi:hypothetical protein